MEEIKNRLQEALELRGMMPVELAKKSGVTKGAISKYLKGTVKPKQNAIGAMAEALRVSPAWLLGYDLTPEGDPIVRIEYERLNETNRARLLAYYQALLDAQGGEEDGDG
jgi:transcriptional regulator with XRE-family HTH domain